MILSIAAQAVGLINKLQHELYTVDPPTINRSTHPLFHHSICLSMVVLVVGWCREM